MKKVTKDEVDYLRKIIPNLYVVSTGKKKGKSSRKKYYIEEIKEILETLKEFPNLPFPTVEGGDDNDIR